jgi:adenosylmethionine-8-amino-7-oxononanoate aminotransferase
VLHRSVRAQPQSAVGGSGLTLNLADGREIIDASGGAAVACLGHGNRRVAAAIGAQAQKLAYAHTSFFSSEPAEALADFLLAEAPGGLTHAFFVSSGSEAMEAALKLARQYFVERGESQRTRFIGRRQSYHGNTLGGLMAGGHMSRRAPYEALFSPSFSRVSPCFPFHYRLPDESDAAYVTRLACELDAEFQRVGSETVIAFCAETVVGATAGCVAPVENYFRRIREVCDRHGALLILDEVMCGMGRTGTLHAWQQEGVTPDIQAVGKGLGGGYQPIAGILVAERVIEALAAGSGVFVHGHTYQAHPVACAAALEVQRIIREEDLVRNVNAMGAVLEHTLRERLAGQPHVGDIRGRGLFFAVEFLADRATKTPFEPQRQFAARVGRAALERGVAIYPGAGTIDGTQGDHVIIAPPYIALAEDLERIVSRLDAAITAALADEISTEWSKVGHHGRHETRG